ncbi:YihY/virulence factor BrkB family protein [Ferruginibacter yonginensis]|uniref:YihY/virulence factor BrkB family protein n=1 Tax=Ferruginibacter yonginensis TaxID=1310416 RepID=A0ABV8QUD4_9BACT
MKQKLFVFGGFLKQVLVEFIGDNILKYSASLAYYTMLSIAPLLVIVLTVMGTFFGKEAVNGELYNQINKLVGSEAAMQIQTSIQNIHLYKDNVFATTIGVVVLIIGATGIFGEIQDSLNRIWGLKLKAQRAWWKVLIDRLISFSLIISLGFVLIVSLVLNAIAAAISGKISSLIPGVGNVLVLVIDSGVSLIITTFLFGAIFKILPDAKIKWKDVGIGALITAGLFLLGKFGIGYYLGQSKIGSIYGAAGSIMILMIWVYYSATILYLGAVFTKVYATNFGGKIYPSEYSVWVKVAEIPMQTVQLKD